MMRKLAVLGVVLSTVAMANGPGDEPLAVKFSVGQAGGGSVLLAGELAVTPSRPARVEHKAASGPAQQSLVLEVQPLDGARVLVRARWSDLSAQGESVQWEPTVVVSRGVEAEVRLDFPSGTRLLKLRIG